MKAQTETRKEPLMSHPAPSRPWEKVGIDIFTQRSQDYLVTVDYLSGYFEVDRLPSKKAVDVIYALRQQWARHGIPVDLVSDNAFASSEFKKFAERWEFQHTFSSPRYPQSNGRAEAAVKTAKRLMSKANESNCDPFFALLDWRNTQSEQTNISPAQIMFGRRTRTLLPSAEALLTTPNAASAQTALTKAKQRQALYYNRGAKDRPALAVGQTVRVRFDEDKWRKAEVSRILPHRSYEVRFDDGSTRRRTSRHVRFSAEPPIVIKTDVGDDESTAAAPPSVRPTNSRKHDTLAPPAAAAPVAKAVNNPNIVTRSGRQIRRPARFQN